MQRLRLAQIAMTLSVALFPPLANSQAETSHVGSTAFCLFELPADGDRRILLNLGIVQYVELRATELRIYYGGGNFGGGHEVRVPLANKDEGIVFVKRMQVAAASCSATPSR